MAREQLYRALTTEGGEGGGRDLTDLRLRRDLVGGVLRLGDNSTESSYRTLAEQTGTHYSKPRQEDQSVIGESVVQRRLQDKR